MFGGDPFTDASGTKRSLAVVHQSSPMDMMLSVRDNIKIAVAFRGLTWRQARGRVTELVDEFNLGSCMDKVAFTLSGGQQRRVQIVRSLVVAPRLFLLDEPSIGLDPTGRRRLWDHLGRLRAEHGVTLVLTSHNMDEIEQNCSQVIVLKEGRIIRNAPHGDITAEFGGTSAVVTFAEEVGPDELREIAGTHGVALKSLDRIRIEVIGDDLEGFVSTLLKYWAGRAGAIRSIAFSCVSLEEAFIRLTERA
ncbi:ATP-binding cassette domain-containing protein [Kitasatospora viridis]